MSTDTLNKGVMGGPTATPGGGSFGHGGSTRQSAISAAVGYRSSSPPVDYIGSSPENVFGENVFSKSAMKKRLPSEV